MNIDIPKQTPLGIPVKTIGIWMSGGADSALLCYLLAKKIKEEQLNITIRLITIDYKRPFVFKAGPVREKIEEILDAKQLFEQHLVYNPPEDTIWTPEELAKQFHIRNYEHFRDNKFQLLYSGITTNPPQEVQQTFKYGILPDVEAKRGVEVQNMLHWAANVRSGDPDNFEARAAAYFWKSLFPSSLNSAAPCESVCIPGDSIIVSTT
jgi:hypothetical protein